MSIFEMIGKMVIGLIAIGTFMMILGFIWNSIIYVCELGLKIKTILLMVSLCIVAYIIGNLLV